MIIRNLMQMKPYENLIHFYIIMRLGKARANLRRFAEKSLLQNQKGLGIDKYVLQRVSSGTKDCTKEVKLECAYFLRLRQNSGFLLSNRVHVDNMSLDMRIPTMWHVRPAKAPTSLRIHAV